MIMLILRATDDVRVDADTLYFKRVNDIEVKCKDSIGTIKKA
jgi:hypothetical protein